MSLRKRKNLLFIACWIAYTATYICRLNFSAALPELLRHDILNTFQAGVISSCLFITYGAGQIVSGFLGDKLKPRDMVFGGLFVSSLCNILLFFFCENYYATLFLWGINGFAQSTVWSPILREGALYFSGDEKTRFGINLSTTVPIGTLLSYAVSLFAIRYSGYKAVFMSCGVIVMAVAILWMSSVDKITSKIPLCVKTNEDSDKKTMGVKMPKPVFTSCVIALVVISIPIAVHGALKDGVTSWVPTFIGEKFSVSTDFSLLLTMILPIVNVTGAYIAKYINKYLKNEIATSGIFFAVASVALFVIKQWGSSSVYLSVVCLAIITNCMFAINVMLITLIPLRFARYGKTSTMTGVLNSVTYLGCGASILGCGGIIDTKGWDTVILMWLIIAIIGAVVCIPATMLWNKFRMENRKVKNAMDKVK